MLLLLSPDNDLDDGINVSRKENRKSTGFMFYLHSLYNYFKNLRMSFAIRNTNSGDTNTPVLGEFMSYAAGLCDLRCDETGFQVHSFVPFSSKYILQCEAIRPLSGC